MAFDHMSTKVAPYYMAPEVMSGDMARVDLWSIGVITYVLMWGIRAEVGITRMQLWRM